MTVAIGCTGGKHRSVAMTEEIARRLPGAGLRRPAPPTATSGGSDVPALARAVPVVALGGGHGPARLSALRLLVDELVVDDLTAVVTVADNGGSSGRLRGEFGVLPPGDLRMALAALCGDDEWGQTWAEVLQHRFAGDGEMHGHVVGNLLIVGLWELLGDHVDGLDWVGRLLGAPGRVLPMALTPLDITAAGPRRSTRRPRRASRRSAARSRWRPPTGIIDSIALDPGRPAGLPRGARRRSRPPTGSCSARVRGSPR